MNKKQEDFEYAGFWRRLAAGVIDETLLCVIVFPMLYVIYGLQYFEDLFSPEGPTFWGGYDLFLSMIAPFVATILFWQLRGATPGKMVVGVKILSAKTGLKASVGQLIGRYFGYFISALFMGFGFLVIGINSKKRGMHDHLAGTIVVRTRGR